MLKKIIKTVLMLSLFTLLVFGEGSHSDNDGGSRNDDIGNIIKNSSIENSQSEKERKKQEREEKKRLKKEEKERKKREKQGIFLPEDNNETDIDNGTNDKNNQNNIDGKENISNTNNKNNTINTTVPKNNNEQKNNTNINNNVTNGGTDIVNEDISKILEENRKKEEQKKPKIDKRKPVVQAIDKEKEEASQYKDKLLKFIATKDGKIIKKELETQQHPIASLTKVMNILVALDEVDKGNVSLDDKVCFTPQNANVGGSWLNVKVGDCYLLRDLLRSEIIYSANNSAYLVAYHVGKGNIEYFVKLMNQKAKELGMNNTEFHTPAGLPTTMTGKGMDVSTAYDMFLMGKKAIEDKRIREWASEPELVLVNPAGEQVIYKSRNHLLGQYGIYGLKTGFHVQAGYNIIVTGKMGNIEIISVVLGHKTHNQRTKDQLEEFSQIKNRLKKIHTMGEEIGEFKIKDSPKRKIKGVLAENVYQLDDTNYDFKTVGIDAKAKINKGDVIGKMEVLSNGNVVSSVDILAIEEAEELSWFGKLLRFISFGLL
ncbi:D-alanyl-D-alanine carboxypeptidase family protein [Pseudoleptotrichia goodfellowii]|jgi:beta-lactamase|uniref:serine-type D-Ala-D-Ala carboxypeptidase n=1 Tax=Pseudoleptotrichia goodfellowii TaxID=157692 RepID=A0A510JFJ0_9FUSO|nr:D-alanyl-D-alanine carboxypeptidase family protein [Pseudoleptotrichia goodfellowii]BBM36985.1 putative serine-type D-Ala-D-Ala carboxypeptidase [Pseudoleptotrichia goodfellowii]